VIDKSYRQKPVGDWAPPVNSGALRTSRGFWQLYNRALTVPTKFKNDREIVNRGSALIGAELSFMDGVILPVRKGTHE
jgi:hypothetical protein